MAITTRSDRKTDRIELVEVKLWPLVVACKGSEKLKRGMHERHAKTGLGEILLFKFFNSFDLTNNIR